MEAPLGSCLVLKEERSWRPSQDDGGHLMEKPRANVWCVENAGATFLVCSPENGSPDGELCTLTTCRPTCPVGMAGCSRCTAYAQLVGHSSVKLAALYKDLELAETQLLLLLCP